MNRSGMTDVVLLFAGQGAQRVGMGKDLAQAYPEAAALFARADEVLERSLTSIMFDGPNDALTRTANCQPALFVHGLALWEVLKARVPGLNPTAAAGLSLGELTAHTAAGTFSFDEGLRLVACRGALMDEACAATTGTMAAMIGGDEEAVLSLAADCDVEVANFNAPGQIVLSGTVEGIDRAVGLAKERGIRIAKKLNVAGAYHSRLMAGAQEKLGKALANAPVGQPTIPVLSNFTGSPVHGADEIRETLTKQVTGSVRWVGAMRHLLDDGHSQFLELGPGKVLSGLMARIEKGTNVIALEDAESLEAAVASL